MNDYNIFYERDAFAHYIKNVVYGNEKNEIHLKFNKNTFNSDFYDKYYSLNNEDTLKNFNTFLLNSSEDKIRFNHSNYFIYKIIDWDTFRKSNSQIINNNLNNNDIFEYFVKNLKSDKNFKLKFDLHYLSKSLIENIDKVYIELGDFTSIINKNIIKNDNNFLLDVLSINDFFVKYDDDYNILHIPEFYIFNNHFIGR